MPQDFQSKIPELLFSLIFAILTGIIISDVYLTFRHGINLQAVDEFDLLTFWYETPIYKGYATDAFYNCLKIVGASMLLATLILFFLLSKKQHHGTARWGRFQEMVRLGYIKRYKDVSGPIFGKTTGPRWFGKYLTNGEQPHSLIVAPTRAGKGVGIVIPTLLTFNGSVVALDVKGELFDLTSRARQTRGDRIFKFSPLDREGRTHCYNPVLDIVAVQPERRFSETRRLATNLITAKGKGAEGFLDGARDLFVAGVLACIERGTPTIGAVYDLFALPGEKYKLFAQLAEETSIPEVRRIFDNMASNDTKIITSYTSVLGDGGLNLWADPLIKNATSRSDFSIYDLRRDPTSIYLCVSPNDLEVIAPLVRLIFQQLVSILQRSMPEKDEIFEVLFLLDEFKHLGQLEAIETAVTTIAGYKGRFMFIIQSLSALTGAYEQAGKQNFLSNTGIQVFMATADDETPEYISKAIGDYTYTSKSKSYNQKEWFNANIQYSDQGTNLLRPEQVRMISEDKQIVLIKGQPPLHMHKVKYYSDRHLKRIFDAQDGPLPLPDPIPLTAEPTKFSVDGEREQAEQSEAVAASVDLGAPDGEEAAFLESLKSQQAASLTGPAQKTEPDLSDEELEAREQELKHFERIALEQRKQREKAAQEEAVSVETAEQAAARTAQRELLERIIALQKRNVGNSYGT